MAVSAQGLKRGALEVQEFLHMLGLVFRGVVTRPIYRRDIIEQLDAIGLGSLTVVILTGLFTGMVLALQSGMTLDQFGARSVVGRLVSASMVKELGPVLTALMVTGRVGSGRTSSTGRDRGRRGAAVVAGRETGNTDRREIWRPCRA